MTKKSKSSCACCSYPQASPHHGGFNVCSACMVVETKAIAQGPVTEPGSGIARDAEYEILTYTCGSASCRKKAFLGSRNFVIKYLDQK